MLREYRLSTTVVREWINNSCTDVSRIKKTETSWLTKIRTQNRCTKRLRRAARKRRACARSVANEKEPCATDRAWTGTSIGNEHNNKNDRAKFGWTSTDWTAYVWSASGYSRAMNAAGLSRSMVIHAEHCRSRCALNVFSRRSSTTSGPSSNVPITASIRTKNMTDPAQVGGHKRSASSIVVRSLVHCSYYTVSELSRRVSQRSYQLGRSGFINRSNRRALFSSCVRLVVHVVRHESWCTLTSVFDLELTDNTNDNCELTYTYTYLRFISQNT